MSKASSAWWRALREADSTVFGRAFSEVLIVGGLSIMPLIIGAFGTFYLQDFMSISPVRPLTEILIFAIFGGQLYFYAMAFIAVVVWHSGQDFRKPFPLRIIFLSVSFFLGMVCTFFFGISPALSKTDITGLSTLSIAVYVVAALMYLLILAFKDVDPPDIERQKRESEESLAKRVKSRRGILK